MHEVVVTVIGFRRAARHGLGVSGTAATPEQVTALVQAADAAARGRIPAEDRAELVAGDARRTGTTEPATTAIDVFDEFAPALGEAFGQADAEDRILYGFVIHEVTTTYLGSSTGPAAAPRAADRALRLHRQEHRAHQQRLGRRRHPRLPRRRRRAGWPPTVAQRLAWAERRIDLPAGRYDTILPPSSVADLMIDAYWGAGARIAHDGRVGLLPAAVAAPGSASKVVAPGVRLFSDPAYAGLECAPVRHRRRAPTTGAASTTTACRSSAPTGSATAG